MFNPSGHRTQCEKYIGRFLESQVDFIQAELLTKSTREAPWRLDVRVNGVPRSYVLQLDTKDMEYGYRILKAVESIPVSTPHGYGLDLQGEGLGVACFFRDFIAGESLLGPMLAGEAWAEELYRNTVCELQAVTEEDLGDVPLGLERNTADDLLEDVYAHLKGRSLPLADAAYRELKASMPELPPARFSNGDLWLDNFIIRDGKLAGIIDFQGAAFSDPVFEFLLSFFVSPELKGRGIEERYCQQIGVDPVQKGWNCQTRYLMDTKPVPVLGYKRNKKHSDFLGKAGYGVCVNRN